MQMWSRPPIRNQLMHLLHHNILRLAWSYLLLSAPPTPPADLSLSTNIIITAPQIHIRTSSYPPIISVDERDQSYDAKRKHVMQIRSRLTICNQFMHLLHHNIVRQAWSYLLLSAPPNPPADLSSSVNIIITAPQIHIRTSSLQVRLVSSHGTLHTRDMSSKDYISNADIPDINIPTWFELHRLPYNDVIVTKL